MKGFEEWTLADVERMNAQRGKKTFDAGDVLTIQAETIRPVTPAPKPAKYRNKKTLADGFVFDSQREAEFWLVLRLREKAGDITELRRQVDFPLYSHDLVNPALAHHICDIRLDMVFRDHTGQLRYLDPKGFRTRLYLMKRQWFEKQYQATLEEV